MSRHPAVDADRLFMVTCVSDVNCGGGNHIFNLTTGLQKLGCDVHVICFEAGSLMNALRDAGVPTLLSPIRGKSDLHGWGKLRQLLQIERPFIVHSHGERGTFMATWAARTVGIPVRIATVHRSIPQTGSWTWPLRRLYTLAETCTLRVATTGVVTVSESLRSDLIRRGAGVSGRIVAIPNGTRMLESSCIADLRQQSKALRRGLALADDAYVIGTVGRLAREKGLEYAIEAMAAVLERVPHAVLIIVGDGPRRDTLVAQVKAMRLEASVRFVGHQTDVDRWLALFDLFVLSTPWEAFGLALIEAMRFSIPVIATNRAGPAEIIENQQSGILVAPGDSGALARAIIVLSKDPERAARIGRSGFDRVQQFYSVDKMVEATLALYDEQRARH
jgi:glycosyltransferase involved in cell wall biosynthesis